MRIQVDSFTFEDSLSVGMDDVHLDIESLHDAKKNGVYVTIPSYINDREIKMHVAIKNGKDAMRFSLRDASGLPTSGLGGIIGESIIVFWIIIFFFRKLFLAPRLQSH